MDKLKYQGFSVVFQEVPNEISLAINISGCPYKCRGCHSQYLWEYSGRYLLDDFDKILDSQEYITCVCFMGGDQNEEELIGYCNKIHELGLKVCLYTGATSISNDLCEHLDYLKVGPYIERCGGLNKKTTNQRMYKIVNNELKDITSEFCDRHKI